MTVKINELVIRTEILKREVGRDDLSDEAIDRKKLQTQRQKLLSEDKKKRER